MIRKLKRHLIIWWHIDSSNWTRLIRDDQRMRRQNKIKKDKEIFDNSNMD